MVLDFKKIREAFGKKTFTSLLYSFLKNRNTVLCTSPWPSCEGGPGRAGVFPIPPLYSATSGPAKEPPLYETTLCLMSCSLALAFQRNTLCLFQMFRLCQKPGNTLLTASHVLLKKGLEICVWSLKITLKYFFFLGKKLIPRRKRASLQ